MKQPKFKFGDIVEGRGDRDEKVIFEITDIKKYPDGFSYSNSSIDGYFSESDIALYQEPQKKKLYAYKKEIGLEVKFSPREQAWIGHITDRHDRAPEYDIEYPEPK